MEEIEAKNDTNECETSWFLVSVTFGILRAYRFRNRYSDLNKITNNFVVVNPDSFSFRLVIFNLRFSIRKKKKVVNKILSQNKKATSNGLNSLTNWQTLRLNWNRCELCLFGFVSVFVLQCAIASNMQQF